MKTTQAQTDAQLHEAARETLLRQLCGTYPAGRRDGPRWYPAAGEHCSCCNSIRAPSRAWPLSLLKHCLSTLHVANLYSVDAGELKRVVRRVAKKVRALQESAIRGDGTWTPAMLDSMLVEDALVHAAPPAQDAATTTKKPRF